MATAPTTVARPAAAPIAEPVVAPKVAPTATPTENPNANSVSWTMPTPQMPPNVPGDALGQVASALVSGAQNAPVLNAQNQAALEAAKAAAISSDDQIINRLLPALRANPALGNSPALIAALGPVLARRGLQLPRDASGQVDGAKLLAMITPAPTMSQTTEQQVYADLTKKELGMGKGGYSPGMFLSDVKAARDRLAAAGMSTAGTDEYLSPDGTRLADSFVDNYVGQKTEEEIQHLHDLGIQINNVDQYRDDSIAEKKREFNDTQTYKYAALSVREQQINNQMQIAQKRLNLANGNLAARWASVENAKNRFGLENNTSNLNAYQHLLNYATKSMSDAQTELDKDTTLATTIANTPGYQNNPTLKSQFDFLTSEISGLQTSITTMTPKLETEKANAAQGISSVYNNITGANSTVSLGTKGASVPLTPGYTFTGQSETNNGVTRYRVTGPQGAGYWTAP